MVDADHIEIMPPELHSLLRANILSNAIAVLTGVTSGVAHHVFSMLLPDEISGRALCAEDREYVLKETPSSGGGVWILTTAVEPRHELVIGQDLLLRAYRVRGSSRTRPTS